METRCPECDAVMKGRRKCACGYFHKGAAKVTEEYARIKARADADSLAEARQWLIEKGIMQPGMSTADRMLACADFRQHLRHEPRPRGVEWASNIIRRAEDETLPSAVVKLAAQALQRAGLAAVPDDEWPDEPEF